MKRFFFILSACFVIAAPSRGAFLNSSWGSRPAGMGNAFTAVADDVNAVTWNPAGMIQCREAQATFMFDKPYYGLENVNLGLGYAAYMRPVSFGVFGLAVENLSADAVQEDAYILSFAQKINRYIRMAPDLSYGVNIKYLKHMYFLDERTTDDPVFANGNSAGAVGIDFGLWFRPFPGEQLFSEEDNTYETLGGVPLTFGLMCRNLNSPDVGLKDIDIVPPETRLGVAYKFLGITSSLDVGYRDKDTNVYFGMEKYITEGNLPFRVGLNKNEADAGFGYSFAVKGTKFLVDYAFSWPLQIQGSNGSHRLSLSLKFNGAKNHL